MAGPERAKRVEGSEPGHRTEIEPLHLHLAGILFDLVEHAEPSKSALHADVIVEVHRAIQVEVVVR